MNSRGSKVTPIHTAVPGRIRFKVAGLYRARPASKARLEARLNAADDIQRVDASTLTGNLLVLFALDKAPKEITGIVEREVDGLELARSASISRFGHHDERVDATDASFVEHVFQGKDKRAAVSQADETAPDRGWHGMTREAVLAHFNTARDTGLTSDEASARLARRGRNALLEIRSRSSLSMLLAQFQNLPVALLGVAAGVSAVTGGMVDAIAILGVVTLNAAIGYATERHSEKTINALTHVDSRPAAVLRDQIRREIPIEEAMVGDILLLAPGMTVAADARLIKTKRLSVDESQLTGESLPVFKSSKGVLDDEIALADRKNMVYRGTSITGGSGTAVIVATGQRTRIGRVQSMVQEAQPPRTPMQQQLDRMGYELVLLSGAVCGLVFIIGLLRGHGVARMFKSAISLAVAALPEGLPTVATTTLALGIRDMRRQQVLVRQLEAVETLGAVQVLCLDKTGTLTMNRMSVSEIYLGAERIGVSQSGRLRIDAELKPGPRADLDRFLHVLALCNEATLEGEDTATQVNGSATEGALLRLARDAGVDVAALRRSHPLRKMNYRSTDRLFMRTTHDTADGQRLVAIKGNPTQVLSMCRWRLHQGAVVALDEAEKARIREENERLAAEALRVLGVAYAEGDRKPAKNGLVWVGLVAMRDQLRAGVAQLIRGFHDAGVDTLMITGDQRATARAVGRQIGLNGERPLGLIDSSELDRIDLDSLADATDKIHVFSRVNPGQKLKIVQALQRAGKIVAMSGDGINDGPALRASDIGVVMGDSGTAGARAVGDVVLEGDRLDAMLTAIGQGRTIYTNIRKSIHFLLATNLSEIEMTLAAVLFGSGPPLTPMQLLWINLLTDIFPSLALAMEPAEPDVLKHPPRDPHESIIRRKDFARLGRESAVITGGALASYAYGLLRYGAGPRTSTQAFLTLVIAQLLHAQSCRSEHTSLFDATERPPNRYLNAALGGSLTLQLLTVLVPGLRGLLGTTPIGLLDGVVIGAGALAPLLINEFSKTPAKVDGDEKDHAPSERLPTHFSPARTSRASVSRGHRRKNRKVEVSVRDRN